MTQNQQLIERLVWALDDRCPEEETDAVLQDALLALKDQGVSLDHDAYESRIATADWRHLCEKAFQHLTKNRWVLTPKAPKGWDVVDEAGTVIAGHRNPVKAVMRAAGFRV